MLTKFETKSNRVKGLSFHSKRPWILASLHNGMIQLWDYRMGTLLDRYDEHEGPVRGICFHKSQPLFVSGGDDYKIKLWNYKLKRCTFTLLGHLDYIRTVEFHHEYPWILSASDDQTVRIWNWQSRSCVAVLTGHNHYVMCATFHPREDLIASSSLDQTVRVWDISGLRKKAAAGSRDTEIAGIKMPPVNTDLFGGTDALVKYVMEGHDRGVNWVSFHHTLPILVSGADDRQVRMWRMNDSKAWEIDTLRGHVNNVSCVVFHSKQEFIISNSEDKSIRVWDMGKRTPVMTFRREHDRFWILAAHPELNLLAAGHDSGMIVFKWERERPAYALHGNQLFYIKDRYLRVHEMGNNRDVPIMTIRRPSSASVPSSAPYSMSYSAADNTALFLWKDENDTKLYELHTLPQDGGRGESAPSSSLRGSCIAATFVARQRFAVLDKCKTVILIKNLKNETTKRIHLPFSGQCDAMFYGGTGMVLLFAEDKVVLLDVQQRKVVAELNTPPVKYVVWSPNMEHVALLSKHSIILATKKLEHLGTVHETIRVKSGSWDNKGVFVYSTLNHIKYCLVTGDHGIIRTLDFPLYIVNVRGNQLECLDREGKWQRIAIDATEFNFKLALHGKRFDEVLRMIRHSSLCGESILAFLQEKGYPEVALHFVKDEKTRFNLAIQCGNLNVALETATVVDDKDCWNRLAAEALRQGNVSVVEMAYHRTKNFERLSFLYLITGDLPKLQKMLTIAEMRGDVMGRYHNSLYLGDVEERVKILSQVGQKTLAYLTAATHNITGESLEKLAQKKGCDKSELGEKVLEAAQIEESLGAAFAENEKPTAPVQNRLLFPPVPIVKFGEGQGDWPLLNVSKSMMDMAVADGVDVGGDEDLDMGDTGGDWGGDDLDLDGGDPFGSGAPAGGDDDIFGGGDDEEGGWDTGDLDIPDLAGVNLPPAGKAGGQYFVAPQSGVSNQQRWTQVSSTAGDHAAAGSYLSALQAINRQFGIVNFDPLRQHIAVQAMCSSNVLGALPGLPSFQTPLHRGLDADGAQNMSTMDMLPELSFTVAGLTERLKDSYKLTTQGKFKDCLDAFRTILQCVPLVVVESHSDVNGLRELIGIAREYIMGMRVELARKETQDPARAAELSAYFTHCNLQPFHLVLALRSAMTLAYKLKNFLNAGSFARRLLELNPKPEIATPARKVLAMCEQNPKNEVQIQYDERNPFNICAASFVPIYRGSETATCSFCKTTYLPEHKGKVCLACEMGQIGRDAPGVQVFQRR